MSVLELMKFGMFGIFFKKEKRLNEVLEVINVYKK